MPLTYAFGALIWSSADAAGSVYTVALPWSPKAMAFKTVGASGLVNTWARQACRHSIGFAASTSDRRCVGSFSADAAPAADTAAINRNDAVVATVDGAGAMTGLLDLTSTSNGFQLTVDDQVPASITVFWEAWGWDSSDAAATGEIAEPGATGNSDYTTSAGLPVSAVLFAGCQLTTTAPAQGVQDSGICVGAASVFPTASSWVFVVNSDEASTTMDTDCYARGDECLAMLTIAGGVVNARASFVQSNSNGFRLNWLARTASTRRYIYLALPQSAGSFKAGTYSIDRGAVGNTATVSGLPFRPMAASLCSVGKVETSAGSSNAVANLMLGMWERSGNRQAMNAHDENGVGDSICHAQVRYDRILIWTDNNGEGTGIIAHHDLDGVFADGWRTRISESGGVSSNDLVGYLAMGVPILNQRDHTSRLRPGPFQPGPTVLGSFSGGF